MDPHYSSKNQNLRIIKFWAENKFNSKHNIELYNTVKSTNGLILCSLNVAGFYSINANLDVKILIKKLSRLLRTFKIDIMCMQEFKFNDKIGFTLGKFID